MDDLVSIIIPVYNVEKYLDKCVSSVIDQTYTNLEIILVDDGSTDSSGKLCNKWSKCDKRIKVYHKKNGGLSDARNVGIENATGNYICFIDSDDAVSNFYIETLYNNLVKYNCEISICSYSFVGEENIELSSKEREYARVYSNEKALKNMLYQKKINNSAWGKLFDIKLFKNVRYPVGKIYEDVSTIYKTFLKSNRICVSSCKYYFYTKREGSISSTWSNKTLDIIDNVKDMENDLKKYEKYNNACNSRVLNADYFVIRQLPLNENYEIYNKLYADIKKRRFFVLFDINSRLKTKIGIIISYFGINLLKKIYSKGKNSNIVKKLD